MVRLFGRSPQRYRHTILCISFENGGSFSRLVSKSTALHILIRSSKGPYLPSASYAGAESVAQTFSSSHKTFVQTSGRGLACMTQISHFGALPKLTIIYDALAELIEKPILYSYPSHLTKPPPQHANPLTLSATANECRIN